MKTPTIKELVKVVKEAVQAKFPGVKVGPTADGGLMSDGMTVGFFFPPGEEELEEGVYLEDMSVEEALRALEEGRLFYYRDVEIS